MPFIAAAGELKTKPTQHSVKELQSVGIRPDIVLCRTEEHIPDDQKDKIALFCNIIVVSNNSYNYIRAGNYNFKLLLPFLIGSIPLAFIGGTLSISKEIFEILLLLFRQLLFLGSKNC